MVSLLFFSILDGSQNFSNPFERCVHLILLLALDFDVLTNSTFQKMLSFKLKVLTGIENKNVSNDIDCASVQY